MEENANLNPSFSQNSNESLKNRIFFIVFFLLLFVVVTFTFSRYFVAKDYYVQAQTDCDPETEKCFIWNCDPNATIESEKCTGDPENDIWYYKLVKKKANMIPDCDPNDENCNQFSCEGDSDCQETLCDEVTAKEQEAQCNDPEQYVIDNPPGEEEECAEDDQECLDSQESEECEPDDEECLKEESSGDEESCAPDDKKCLEEEKASSADSSEEEENAEEN